MRAVVGDLPPFSIIAMEAVATLINHVITYNRQMIFMGAVN